ncbi:MAG: nucleotidyltransferase family protein [Burkholderiales bacterium]|nr:nucleotidyltransferase family protein [Burkholderiales bacterium]
MILAAGRGERMRPLTDTMPKPLLEVGGKPLIVRQIEALARAGFDRIAINVSWLGEAVKQALGDGKQWGVSLYWSEENPALETAGGIARALPLLKRGAVVIVSADIYTEFDYRKLTPRVVEVDAAVRPCAHLVMVPNPPYHLDGDFVLGDDGTLSLDEHAGAARLTFGNIGVYHTDLFTYIDPNVPQKLTPYYRQWIAQNIVSGERYDGFWKNIGAPQDLAEV